VARMAAGISTGFWAYPVVDPLIIADASGNGRMQSNDAVLVARRAAGIDVPQVPARPVLPTATTTAAPKTADPQPADTSPAVYGPLPSADSPLATLSRSRRLLTAADRAAIFAAYADGIATAEAGGDADDNDDKNGPFFAV
jgi:hypothetical protein